MAVIVSETPGIIMGGTLFLVSFASICYYFFYLFLFIRWPLMSKEKYFISYFYKKGFFCKDSKYPVSTCLGEVIMSGECKVSKAILISRANSHTEVNLVRVGGRLFHSRGSLALKPLLFILLGFFLSGYFPWSTRCVLQYQ